MESKTVNINVIPQFSLSLINAEKSLTTNSKNYCVAGTSFVKSLEHNTDCAQLKTSFISGCDANSKSGLLPSNYWKQTGSIQTRNFDILINALLTISLNRTNDFECDLSIGYDVNWSRFCDPRNYLGGGFEGFVNPFILNKIGMGIQLRYQGKGLDCFTNIRNYKNNSSTVFQNPNTKGFLSSDTPSQFDIGFCYNLINQIKTGILFVYSHYNAGKSTSSDIPVLVGIDSNSITKKATNSLIDSLINDKKLTLLTSTSSTRITPTINLDCSSSFANLKGKNNKGRVVKWSIGCSSFIQQLYGKYLRLDSYGINIGTPTYLQTAYNDITKDKIPLVCEISCLTNICGLIIPLYIDIMNKWQGTNFNQQDKEGNVCIMGIKSQSLFGFTCGPDGKAKCFNISSILPQG